MSDKLPVALRAGPLTAMFEPETGFLRYVRLGDHEIIRAIYGAVRDQNWATLPSRIEQLETEVAKDQFIIRFRVTCANAYQWKTRIVGDTTGQITFHFDGEPQRDFLRNRIGLCVLHPITECAGRACTIEHVDGSTTNGTFPRTISPDQPFYDIRALSYEIATTGVRAVIRFEGATFEMEDQRNWTDASFKTYSTPLREPMPVQVRKGDVVKQSVTVSLKGYSRPVLPVVFGRQAQISIATTPVLTVPPLGLVATPVNEVQKDLLRALKLSHLRVEAEQLNLAEQLGLPLHVALTIDDKTDLLSLGGTRDVSLWLLYGKDKPPSAETVRRTLKELGGMAAAGTRQFFADINGARPEPDYPAFVCYGINPQVHQTDTRTLVENIAAQVDTIETVKTFSSKPVVPSPITLKSRFNPEVTLEGGSDVDPRQTTLLCAGWTLASIARLAATGNVHSLTYHEVAGPRGVMGDKGVYPVYHVLADIGDFRGKQVLPAISTHPLDVEALALAEGGKAKRILVASFKPEPSEVKIKTGSCSGTLRYLDDSNVAEACENPQVFRSRPGQRVQAAGGKVELRLGPFAIARLDID